MAERLLSGARVRLVPSASIRRAFNETPRTSNTTLPQRGKDLVFLVSCQRQLWSPFQSRDFELQLSLV
jgi:hypothetical protein